MLEVQRGRLVCISVTLLEFSVIRPLVRDRIYTESNWSNFHTQKVKLLSCLHVKVISKDVLQCSWRGLQSLLVRACRRARLAITETLLFLPLHFAKCYVILLLRRALIVSMIWSMRYCCVGSSSLHFDNYRYIYSR